MMSATAAWLARLEKVSEDELQRRRDVFRSMLLGPTTPLAHDIRRTLSPRATQDLSQ